MSIRARRPTGAAVTAIRTPGTADAVVLVLHGGSADSLLHVGRFSPAALRLAPVARAVARAIPTAAVYRLRNSVRGWNGDGAVVLDDARWAIGLIQADYPDAAIIVMGDSLGGRVAIHLAGEGGSVRQARLRQARVAGAVGLAPWLDASDPVSGLQGVPIAVVQGTADRMIPMASTETWLARSAQAGALIHRATVLGGEHTMLWQHRRWHRLAIEGLSWAMESAGAARADSRIGHA